jgi:phosphatidylglycerophosphate synthase
VSEPEGDRLARRLLGRRAQPVPTQVVVVVDPDRPGAARLRLPDGALLASHVAALAVSEAGQLHGDPLTEASTTAAVERLASVLRERSDVPVAVVDAATVASGTSLGDVVADPRPDGSLLRYDESDRGDPAGGGDAHVVAVRVPSAHRVAVADALTQLLDRESGTRVLDLVADACAATGLPLEDRGDPSLPVARPDSAGRLADAWAALEGLEEVRVRLRRSQRGDDGFLSTFLVRPLSRRLTPLAVARGLAPSTVTAVALLLGILAAVAYALAGTGHATGWRVLGSLLLLASLVVDCVDGEVARSTRTFSARGAWLDVGADRVKEYAVYAGLAAGAGGSLVPWWLAFAAMALLVTRHFVDFGFAAATRPVPDRAAHAPAQGRVAAWSDRTNERPALMWAKRAVILPVGERTLLLIVLAPLAGVRVTLLVLLALGVVAAGWTTAGRLGRTRAAGQGLRWLVPALERVVEQGLVALLVVEVRPTALPGAYAWLAVVAFGSYDLVYRQRLTGDRTSGTRSPGLPWWWARAALVLLVLLVTGPRAGAVLTVLAALLAVALAWASGRFWWRWVPSTP